MGSLIGRGAKVDNKVQIQEMYPKDESMTLVCDQKLVL